MRKQDRLSLKDERDNLLDEVVRLQRQVRRQQMEIDILKKAEELIKKDQGISGNFLTNREKTLVVDVLRGTYTLPELLRNLQLARSSLYRYSQPTTIGVTLTCLSGYYP